MLETLKSSNQFYYINILRTYKNLSIFVFNMNRGRRTHIHAIQLFEIEPLPKVEVVLTKGRNQQLLHERNQKIVHRYYYKAKLQKMQYETLLTELEQEFNYSKKTIYNILFVEHYELVMEVMRAKPNTQALRKAYPYLVWK